MSVSVNVTIPSFLENEQKAWIESMYKIGKQILTHIKGDEKILKLDNEVILEKIFCIPCPKKQITGKYRTVSGIKLPNDDTKTIGAQKIAKDIYDSLDDCAKTSLCQNKLDDNKLCLAYPAKTDGKCDKCSKKTGAVSVISVANSITTQKTNNKIDFEKMSVWETTDPNIKCCAGGPYIGILFNDSGAKQKAVGFVRKPSVGVDGLLDLDKYPKESIPPKFIVKLKGSGIELEEKPAEIPVPAKQKIEKNVTFAEDSDDGFD